MVLASELIFMNFRFGDFIIVVRFPMDSARLSPWRLSLEWSCAGWVTNFRVSIWTGGNFRYFSLTLVFYKIIFKIPQKVYLQFEFVFSMGSNSFFEFEKLNAPNSLRVLDFRSFLMNCGTSEGEIVGVLKVTRKAKSYFWINAWNKYTDCSWD